MKRLLVYDTFEAHVTENVKAVFAKENSNLALIPHRLTSVLEPIVFLESGLLIFCDVAISHN